ncbi:MAG: LPS-assembly protein LptD [Ignavibacteria bacterium]|nr:LPS-assembly protein LptD [Ignavibacteria bacterium]
MMLQHRHTSAIPRGSAFLALSRAVWCAAVLLAVLCVTRARAQDLKPDSPRFVTDSARGTERDSARMQGEARLAADSARSAAESGGFAVRDSLRIITDTTLSFSTRNSVDTIVTYTAKDTVVYLLDDKRMKLYGSSAISFGTMGLKAERITLNWDASTFQATGIPDTAKGREGRFTGTPILNEGAEKYEGLEMSYNFKTKKGVILEGQTVIGDGFYLGERIKRASEDVYFISSGQYTTCDKPDHKHFYFGSPRMKVVPNDVIIAEPIVFFVEDIPLFALPFAVIPGKSGRSSGIVIPTFGDDYARGRFLKGGGYYLAASDYWDLKLTADWYSKGGYQMGGFLQYSKRYSFNGSIDASYGRQTYQIGDPRSPDDLPRTDYRMVLRHSQQIDPSSQLSADLSYLTDSYYQSFSNNINQLLNQEVRSSASYSTSWEGTNRSLSVNIERSQNLVNGTSSNIFPRISFNQSQIYPFRPAGSNGDGAWYEMIGFDYSGQALQTINVTARDVIRRDTAGRFDTTTVKETFDRRGLQHSFRLLSSPKFGYVTIQPSFSLQERWYDHRVERAFNPADSTVSARDVRGFFALHTFSLGVSANTKLYGTLSPNIAGIIGIRHTMQPQISYSYNPDYSTSAWGYYQSYRGIRDSLIRYDPYTGYGNMPGETFGGVGYGESQTIGMSISNVFEMKMNPASDDTTLTPRKFQLLSLNLSSGYNIVADSLKLSPISLSYSTRVQELVDMSGSATYSPYVIQRRRLAEPDSLGHRAVAEQAHLTNRYIAEDGVGFLRLIGFSFNLQTRLSSDMFASKPDTSVKALPGNYAYRIPWSMSFGFNYSMDQFDPDNTSRQASMYANASISPTPNWRITASTYYDLVTKTVGAPQIGISRDLHCWEMNFNWVPSGYYRHFELVIRLKAPQLQDIKLERKGSDRGVY